MGPRSARARLALTIVNIGAAVAVVTFLLLSWNDGIEQAAMGEYAWAIDPGTFVVEALKWAGTVALWCAVAGVATSGPSGRAHPWRLPVVMTALVCTWALVAWRTMWAMVRVDVPWLGPAPGLTFGNDPYGSGSDPFGSGSDPWLLPRPGLATPVLLIAALALSCWTAHRLARATATPPDAWPHARSRLMASAILGPPVLAAAVFAIVLQVSSDEYLTLAERVTGALVSPGARIVLAVVAALLLAGTGRVGWVVLGVVQLWAAGPLVLLWWSGGSDALLATAALSTLATGMAAAVLPTARAIGRLDGAPGGIDPMPTTSVPEGADADDRARA
jgi:hypothetical protein